MKKKKKNGFETGNRRIQHNTTRVYNCTLSCCTLMPVTWLFFFFRYIMDMCIRTMPAGIGTTRGGRPAIIIIIMITIIIVILYIIIITVIMTITKRACESYGIEYQIGWRRPSALSRRRRRRRPAVRPSPPAGVLKFARRLAVRSRRRWLPIIICRGYVMGFYYYYYFASRL